MGHDWIIDVLTDLRAFARENEMGLLAAQIDEAVMVANVEIASKNTQISKRRVMPVAQSDYHGNE